MSLEEKKVAAKKNWEEIFGLKLEEELTKEGLEVFWSEGTSLRHALDMLTIAAIASSVDIIVYDEVDDIGEGKQAEAKNEKPYRVIGRDNVMFETEFESKRAAEAFIIEQVKYSPFTLDVFKVVKVM